MPLQNKHSRTAGNKPNLIPGQMGVNLADGVLWMRFNGRKIAVNIAALQAKAAPAAGPDGAPLVQTATGFEWDAQLAPSSLADGHTPIDAPPPANGWGVPGLYGAQASSCSVLVNGVLVEPFYVASDALTTSALGFYVTDAAPTGHVRVGVLDHTGAVLVDQLVTPAAGLNTVAVSKALPAGSYTAMLWSSAGIDLNGIAGFRPEQGWGFDGSGNPVFVNRQTATANLTAGLITTSANLVTSAAPGELHCVLMQWQIAY